MNNDTPQPTVKESLTVQKPRCPWPVHQWPKEAALCIALDDNNYRFDDKENWTIGEYIYCNQDFNAESVCWTRAEALATQMLTSPDKPGVWVIYEKHATLVDEFKDLTTTPLYDEYDGAILYETIRGRWSSYSVLHSKFYYMGPLPTAESEVWHE